jgi:hypothetical protein
MFFIVSVYDVVSNIEWWSSINKFIHSASEAGTNSM